MTQKDKELLLKDLCARLPYGVKMNHIADDEHSPKTLIGVAKDMITLEGLGGYECVDTEDYKPYLFPLSSMTEEQILAFWKIEFKDNGGYENDWDFPLYPPKVGNHFIIEALDWLNRNHFDYRGLIEKGLAIDATGLNIY